MSVRRQAEVRKRPVNLTLNEELVGQAKDMTDNLSALVESLLSEFVAREKHDRLARKRAVEDTVTMWNAFNDKAGSIADEYSTL